MATAKKKKRSAKKKNNHRNYVIWMWTIALFLLVFISALFVIVKYSRLPDISELDNPKYELSTIIYDINNRELGKNFIYNRVWTTYEELNTDIIKALVATEDVRFFKHSGIDARGTVRAVAFLGKRGGASTLTQQLAKLFFTERANNLITRLWQKMQEWLISIELEKRYTKEEILAMYLNKFDFLYNSHGIESASYTYFGKSQKDLSTDEVATLIAMLKWPNRYNPKINPDKAKHRRNVVLNQMLKYGYITEEENIKLKEKELDNSNFKSAAIYKGPAPYFRAELMKWVKRLLDKQEYRKNDGTKYNVALDGLKIYTTIDLDYQILAEKAVAERMELLQKDFNKVWKNKDPWTYYADKDQLRLRKSTLNRYIKESNRFKNIRKRILGPVIDSITQRFPDARLLDTDIQRMLNQEKDKKYLSKLKKKNYVSFKQIKTYNDILASKYWPVLKSKQKELNQIVKKSFNTKVKMRVFAYNAEGEKTAFMTPLDSIKYHKNFLQTGMLAINPQNGFIKAWVGGIDYKYFQYDHINSKRQVGSTFKPFVYATSILNKGISPCMKIQDIQYSITPGEGDFKLIKTWTPGNADEFSKEYITLYEGLRQSKNSVSVKLMKELENVKIVIDLANKFGIDKKDIPPNPSICLGSADLSVMQMTGAYSVFSNNGVYNKPIFVTMIKDKNDKIIYNAVEQQDIALSDKYNFVMVSMLRYASQTIHHMLKSPVGGKSGTTNDHKDGWFMGITPNLVVGTWVGGDEQWIRFREIYHGQGSYMARPIFINFMQKLEKSKTIGFNTNAQFQIPEGGPDIELDCDKYYQEEESDIRDDIFEEDEI